MTSVKGFVPQKPSRSERARATRLRITAAAYTLFCERGYSGATMEDIAHAADVAVQTVYFTFHTKPALLSAAYDYAVLGPDDPLPPAEQRWYRQMGPASNVSKAIRLMVVGIGEMLRRVTPLDTIVRATADRDPEPTRVRNLHERMRAQGYREMLEILRAKSGLRSGVTRERATQLLLLYVGMDVYRVLVSDFGWTHDEWVDWTIATLRQQVFGARRPVRVDRQRAVAGRARSLSQAGDFAGRDDVQGGSG
jgi:AcrR family transcriptional regulator